MSNLTKLEVLKHRHLSLLKKLEERGIEAKYSQLEGEWQITMPPAETNAIEVKVEGEVAEALEKWLKRDYSIGYWTPEQLRNAFLAELLPPQTIMGIPVVEVDGIDALRAYLLNTAAKGETVSPINVGMNFGVEGPMADALAELRENPRPLYTKRCPVDFSARMDHSYVREVYCRDRYELRGDGEVVFIRESDHMAPNWVRDFDKRQGIVNDDDMLRYTLRASGIHSMIGVTDSGEVLSVGAVSVYRVQMTPSLYHLTEAIHHAILSVASAKA